MSNQHAMPSNSMGTQFTEGTPVYDLNGEQVGTAGKHGLAGNMLILHKGIFFHRDIQIPLTFDTVGKPPKLRHRVAGKLSDV